MKIVATNTDQEIAAARAAEEASVAISDLTANLIRIVRGAGRPSDIRAQVLRLATAIEDHREIAATTPIADMVAAIRLSGELSQTGDAADHEVERSLARQAMVHGALQYAASAIVDQRTQQAAGESEMMRGVSEFERILAEKRLEYAKLRRPKRVKSAKAMMAKVRKRTKASGSLRSDP